MQPTESTPVHPRIEGDFCVVVEENGQPKKLADVWTLQQTRPEVFGQLTAEHFAACAKKHPELAVHCQPFINTLSSKPKKKA